MICALAIRRLPLFPELPCDAIGTLTRSPGEQVCVDSAQEDTESFTGAVKEVEPRLRRASCGGRWAGVGRPTADVWPAGPVAISVFASTTKATCMERRRRFGERCRWVIQSPRCQAVTRVSEPSSVVTTTADRSAVANEDAPHTSACAEDVGPHTATCCQAPSRSTAQAT